MSVSVAEYRNLTAKRPKYRNVRTEVDGRKFDSKLEARRYEELKLLRKVGQVLWFIRQVPFDLPGNITYRADFLIVWNPETAHSSDRINVVYGGISIEDCKGMMTRVSLNKIKQLKALYGIDVHLITKERYA